MVYRRDGGNRHGGRLAFYVKNYLSVEMFSSYYSEDLDQKMPFPVTCTGFKTGENA